MHKPRIAIFDLTDCEGCEVRLLSMKKTLMKFAGNVEIINWRLAGKDLDWRQFDICFIEGAIITKKQEKLVKNLRENSKIIIALGACACTGGVPASANFKNRDDLIKYVYGENYQSSSKNPQPIHAIIKVDYHFNGCPINTAEIKEWLPQLLVNTEIKPKNYSVCFECKANGNECLFIHGEPCLGPITLGGCNAACTSSNIFCRGCWGPTREANFPAMVVALKKQGRSKEEIKKILSTYFAENEDFKKI